MPDWLSHILIGLIFAELLNVDKKSLLVLGSLLPDFLSKPYLLGFFIHVNDGINFTSKLYHSPIMGLILPAFIAPFFKYNWKKTYLLIFSGFFLHLIADSFTDDLAGGILLYPFSNGFFSFKLFFPEQYWIFLIFTLVIYGLIKLYKLKKQKSL